MFRFFSIIIFALLFLNNKTFAQHQNKKENSEIQKDLDVITNLRKPRNFKNVPSLNTVASYLKEELSKICDSTKFQEYNVKNEEYKNVIGSIGTEHTKRLIIGAHYDVFGDSKGADDNASGVVGLLELSRLLSKTDLKFRVDFVFYTLEEPPFFRTKNMGSYIHAKYLIDNEIEIIGMICLESIGYFSDKANSQSYPISDLSNIYGTKGDFITIVQNEKNEEFSSRISRLFLKQKLIKTKHFVGNPHLTGIDFSDHLNYWNFNFPAVMITNTAFYRNKNYHTKKDTPETLSVEKINLVIKQLSNAISEY